MTRLLDVNVLVALAWPNHVHHQAAVQWFEASYRAGWATCPLTQSGFVRVSSNQRVVPDARTPAEAILVLRQLTELDGHEFLADDIALATTDVIDVSRILGHRQVTDAHLVALALRHNGRLVTFDRRIADVVPTGIDANVVLQLPAAP